LRLWGQSRFHCSSFREILRLRVNYIVEQGIEASSTNDSFLANLREYSALEDSAHEESHDERQNW
jgi:hypothetical protein